MYLFTLLVICNFSVIQDDVSVNKIEKSNFVELINSIRSIKSYETENFNVRILKLDNPPGSANTPETHEIKTSKDSQILFRSLKLKATHKTLATTRKNCSEGAT